LDRLIALVLLRWRLELRSVLGTRSRLLGLLVAVPALGLMSVAGALAAYSLTSALENSNPSLVLPLLSAGAVVFGFSWALSPLYAGIAATETHDFGRLMHYPVPLPSLLASSLFANMLQPFVLAQLPPLVALALALAAPGAGAFAAALGLLSALALCLAVGQASALAIHAVSRHRRWHDRLLFLGIGLGIVVSLLPLLVLGSAGSGGRATRAFLLGLLERDFFVLFPFSWGVRAAVHGARGELVPGLAWLAGSLLATLAVVGVSAALAQRLYRGELDLGESGVRAAGRPRVRLPGAVGALLEKDLRVTWRDPRLKALMFTGVLGPLLILVALWQGAAGGVSEGVLLSLASFAGLGVLGSNAFGVERQGVALLFSFPVDRLSILLAKNLGAMVLRLPALALVTVATLVAAGAWLVPAVLAVMLLTQVIGAAVDNFVAVLAPVPMAAAGRDPSSPVSGGRGLGAAALAFAAMLVALIVSAPFAFLAWLPYLLGLPVLWIATLPLALAGACGAYFMLASWAAGVLSRREPELVARASGEA
jgi:ABC-2 type transport system permease protein